MSTNFQLTASIKSVTFKPRDFVRIDGAVWSKHRGGLVVSDDTNRYNKQWFWHSDLPQPVAEILTQAGKDATEALTEMGALPTFWPAGLMDSDIEQKFPVNISIEQFQIFNADWDKDKMNIATFKLFSNIHNIEIRQSHVRFNLLDYSIERKIFNALEEHM